MDVKLPINTRHIGLYRFRANEQLLRDSAIRCALGRKGGYPMLRFRQFERGAWPKSDPCKFALSTLTPKGCADFFKESCRSAQGFGGQSLLFPTAVDLSFHKVCTTKLHRHPEVQVTRHRVVRGLYSVR